MDEADTEEKKEKEGEGLAPDRVLPKAKAASKEKDEQDNKNKKQKAEKDKEETEILLVKAALNSLQQLRLHSSLLTTVAMGPLGKLENLMKESKRVGDLYHKATSGERGHGLGSPSATEWFAMTTELRTRQWRR